MHPIYTVGYSAGWTPATLRAELLRLGAVLWDIRYTPRSRLPGWDRMELRSFLGGAFYRHEPALGNRNYREGPIELAAPARAVPAARTLLARCPIVLLCACRDAHSCHRSDAAAFLAQELGAAVVHLQPPVQASPSGLKGLSLTPPWGTLVAVAARFPRLGKHIETRGWSTSYRGRLAIHQTKGLGELTERELAAICAREPFCAALAAVGITEPGQLPRGQIVAVVSLLDCVPTRNPAAAGVPGAPWFTGVSRGVGQHYFEVPPTEPERSFGDYRPGRFAWLLEDIQDVPEPVSCRGAQGLWDVPADVAGQLGEVVR